LLKKSKTIAAAEIELKSPCFPLSKGGFFFRRLLTPSLEKRGRGDFDGM
jgi:hypothetical protein